MTKQDAEGGASAQTNGFDASKTPDYVGRIEAIKEQIDLIMQEARDKCTPLRKDIDDIKKASSEDANIPRRELNSLLTERRLLRQAKGVRAKLSKEQQGNYDTMRSLFDDLDDTPLGRAARKADGDTAQATAH